MSIKRELRRYARHLSQRLSGDTGEFADPATLGKGYRNIERYREIVSDPLNILIERVPEAGYVDRDGYVILHNGNKADVCGKYAYYFGFSDILIINRGVHEPLEEFCFQEMLRRMERKNPVMIELGAYWAHYSMWMKRQFPEARCIMVEPDPENAASGRNNFAVNGYEGEFIVDFVGNSAFQVDRFLADSGIDRVDLLHSDIQGNELEMLEGAERTLAENAIDYVFISTHSNDLHSAVAEQLCGHGYRIDMSSNYERHTTSHDGLIVASSPAIAPLFADLPPPLGRLDIARASARELAEAVARIGASLSV